MTCSTLDKTFCNKRNRRLIGCVAVTSLKQGSLFHLSKGGEVSAIDIAR